MYIYINGRIIKEEEALISIFDHGFMYGLGLFETFRVYQGHAFLFNDHMERLREGLTELDIRWNVTNEEILDAVNDLLVKNNLKDAYIRLNVSAGPSSLGLPMETYEAPTTIIYIKSIPQLANKKEGVFLETLRNTPEGRYRLKSHHYLNNILGKREIGQASDKEGIFLTKEGFLAEGIVSNLFWVKDRVVYTPHIDTGILNGITRRFVQKLLNKKGIKVEEGFYMKEDILSSDEVFATNSIQEIFSITHIGSQSYEPTTNAIAELLQKEYRHYTSFLATMNQMEDK
ncbi:4-amino-4-deoxychorismate lyase [Bacillus mesophilus]|uniref:Aminodeoxychorismate lyase n=1 Tax=Bacillus mesophilus TaxID=1808955 RepID=A0A6M0QCV8_9BACI|nr:aminodeoxychorismate lyase [Bacillus mesophilus]MBM7663447.1 4-amino-4-deoxychorismate lyase [Bacillus mesophilus]NEY74105.1 aminodeoxychorismate lyase [Bacillus mesophilus]